MKMSWEKDKLQGEKRVPHTEIQNKIINKQTNAIKT